MPYLAVSTISIHMSNKDTKGIEMLMVTWIDSHEVQGWVSVDEIGGYQDKEIVTIGFEIERTKKGIVLASSKATNPYQVCGTMIIPKSAIVSIVKLSKHKRS